MSSKMCIEAFSLEAIAQKDQFEAMERAFASDPSLAKITRQNATQPYSYIWYQNPQTGLKTVIRLANKSVLGHILGDGGNALAKYGVDQEGHIYAVKIQQTHPFFANDNINQSMMPVEESMITYDVHLAHGYASTRKTSAIILKFVQVPPNDSEMIQSILYLYNHNGMINYKIQIPDGTIITHNTLITIPAQPEILSQIKHEARIEGHIPPKESTIESTEKSYQVLKIGEATLLDVLESTRTTIDLKEKISIARRISWECSKLHAGKLSRTHQGYIHCDLKPANILLNLKEKSVLLIDYGLSVSVNTTAVLYGTYWYAPVISITNSLTGKLCLSEPRNPKSSRFDKNYEKRTRGMGTGFDVFALKRLIYMPDHKVDPGRCIFTTQEFAQFPEAFIKTISIRDSLEETSAAVNQIKTQNETAEDLTLRLIALEAVDLCLHQSVQERQYDQNRMKITNCTLEQKILICECAELLDLILAKDPAQTTYTRQDIIDKIYLSHPLIFKNQLLMHASILLLDLPYSASFARGHEEWLDAHTEINDLFLKLKNTEDPDERERLKTSFEALHQTLNACVAPHPSHLDRCAGCM